MEAYLPEKERSHAGLGHDVHRQVACYEYQLPYPNRISDRGSHVKNTRHSAYKYCARKRASDKPGDKIRCLLKSL